MDPTCKQCGPRDKEQFVFLAAVWDVARANRLIEGRLETAREIPQEEIGGMAPLIYVNEAHLDHLENPERPGIVAPILFKRDPKASAASQRQVYCNLLIDGNHRARRALRDGRPFTAVYLTFEESWACMLRRMPMLLNPKTAAGKARLAEVTR